MATKDDLSHLPAACFDLLKVIATRTVPHQELPRVLQCEERRAAFLTTLLVDERLAKSWNFGEGYVLDSTARGRKVALQRGLIS